LVNFAFLNQSKKYVGIIKVVKNHYDMNILRLLVFVFGVLIWFSCSDGKSVKAKKIKSSTAPTQSSKKVFDPLSLRIPCDSLNWTLVNKPGMAQRLIVKNGGLPFDTVFLKGHTGIQGIETEIVKSDIDFDGNCDLLVPDPKIGKSLGIKHFYYIFNPVKRKYEENRSLPPVIGSFKLDIKNQRLKLYCPDNECFAYYKYNSDTKQFSLVQGEFKCE
jgi:hypothetical protein